MKIMFALESYSHAYTNGQGVDRCISRQACDVKQNSIRSLSPLYCQHHHLYDDDARCNAKRKLLLLLVCECVAK